MGLGICWNMEKFSKSKDVLEIAGKSVRYISPCAYGHTIFATNYYVV